MSNSVSHVMCEKICSVFFNMKNIFLSVQFPQKYLFVIFFLASFLFIGYDDDEEVMTKTGSLIKVFHVLLFLYPQKKIDAELTQFLRIILWMIFVSRESRVVTEDSFVSWTVPKIGFLMKMWFFELLTVFDWRKSFFMMWKVGHIVH